MSTSCLSLPAAAPPRPATGGAVAALLFATAAWGSLFVVGRRVMQVLDPLWFTGFRYAAAGLALLVLLRAQGRLPWPALRRHAGALTAAGLLGYGVFSVMVFYGVAHSVPSHGAVIMATMPFTTLALRWALDGERPAPRVIGAAALALLGVAGVAGLLGGPQALPRGVLVGDAVTLAGTLGWVAYTRIGARLPGLSVLGYTTLTALAALPWLLGAAVGATLAGLVHWPSPAALRPFAAELAYIALVPTVAAVLAFNHGVRVLGATWGTMFLNVVPLSALAIGAALGQPPQAHELLGAATVMAALAWHAAPRRAAVSS